MRVLRLFGAAGDTVQSALDALPEKWGLTARRMTRGGETLAVLEAPAGDERASASLLDRAQRSIQAACPDALYGEGAVTLPEATVQALLAHGKLLACADADAGALLEPRLEAVPGAEQMFDFGTMSYAHPQHKDAIAEAGQRSASGGPQAVLQVAAGRVQAARRLAGADLAAGCVPCPGGAVVLAGGKKGVWSRAVPQSENPALWLLDMLRRAACGLEQADGTHWTRHGAPLPDALAAEAAGWADPAEATSGSVSGADGSLPQGGTAAVPDAAERARSAPDAGAEEPEPLQTAPGQAGEEAPPPAAPWVAEPGGYPLPQSMGEAAGGTTAQPDGPLCEAAAPALPRRRRRRWPWVLLLALLLLAAAVGAVWLYTGGDWELVLKWLGIREFTLSGASLL